MHIVFVYGTLKRGFPNFEQWMKPFTYLADGATIDKFPLIVGGAYHLPILLNEVGLGQIIKGELFEVDAAGLESLDLIESVGKPQGYQRIEITVTTGKTPLQAWVYVKDRADVDVVHNQLEGEYKLDSRYIPVNKR